MVSAKSGEQRFKYENYCDILRCHGLFATVAYWLFRVFRYTPSRIWFGLPKKISCLRRRAWIWNEEFEKATPSWHDIGVLLLIGVTCAVTWGAWSQQDWLNVAAWWITWLLLIDMIAYHASVLWFDDLGIRQTDKHRKVWSHRRIMFQALLNFAQSICLFAVLYHSYHSTVPFRPLLHDSFTVATSLTRADSLPVSVPTILVDLQVCVAIFFLVVVISVVASIGYNRPELGKSFDD